MPNGMPASINPIKIGMDEHEQKGVTAPNNEAKMFPIPNFFPARCFLILFVGI